MVNTRRMESSGSAADTASRLSGNAVQGEGNSDLCSSSDSEPSQEEESWSSQCQWNKKNQRRTSPSIPTRVRELRNRFVCSDITYSKRRERNSPRRVGLDRRRVYSTHEMQDDSDDFLRDSDEIFSPRKYHSRHLRHSRSTQPSQIRIERCLRPLKRHPTIRNSNSSDNDKPETDLRRSTRQRKLQYDSFNTSWITDAQMIKGYPNLKMDFLSDQDSRNSQEDHMEKCNGTNRQTKHLVESPADERHDDGDDDDSCEKPTRHNGEIKDRRDMKKNMKYIYDYETTEVHTRRVSVRGQTEDERARKDSKKSCIDEQEEKRDKKNKNKDKQENADLNGENEDINENIPVTNGDLETKNEEDLNEEDDVQSDKSNSESREMHETQSAEHSQSDSESEAEIPIRPKPRRSNLKYMDDPRFSPRRTRNRKITDSEKSSDSFDEDIRNQRYKYQLRQRKPKPDSMKTMPLDVPLRRSDRLLHNICPRRHRNRRRELSDEDSITGEVEHPRSRKTGKANYNCLPSINSPQTDQVKSGPAKNVPAPIGPETLDAKVRFASVGGLDNHVRCLREMVVLPMMYPEVFRQFQIQPPRGVLFHGPPGTGKTLLARALANECSFGSRKVSFFMRKGADLLSKWVGESEKQLRMLFEQASQMKPSIIFFDELDGLAPVRSSRQDQIHASIVSTLLALMDGLDNRGEVIVIGATNRIDAIDPALRRPGRFDRELFFSLPARKEREEIIRVHVSQWSIPPSDTLISHLAEHSAGYCGSDLRALCSEAVIQGLRRTYPQVYTTDYRLQLDPAQVKVEKIDFLRARSMLIPASHRVTQGLGRKLPTILEPLLRNPLDAVLALFKEIFPHGLDPALANVKISNTMQTAQLLLTGDTHAQGQSIYLAPALLFHMEHVNTYTLDLAMLYKESGRSPEEGCVEVFNEARRNVPSVIYIPNIEQWWSLVGDTVRAIFLSQLTQMDPSIPVLLLATSNITYKNLPEEISSIFSTYRKEVLHLSQPVTSQREAFFKPLIITASLKPPMTPKVRPKTPPPLPRAPTPLPEPLTEAELKILYDKEEQTLTELRIFLRDMCKKLARNKMFYMFTKPVDLEEVPDYLSIIKEPMDLETMMTKVDQHQYSSAKEFLDDIDLICRNALEYNPAKTPADKQIRHRACSLKDHAHAMIKAEMDSDFEEHCLNISLKRKERKASVSEFLPPFIYTLPNQEDDTESKGSVDETESPGTFFKSVNSSNSICTSPIRKRKSSPWVGSQEPPSKKRVSRATPKKSYQDDNSAGKSSSGDESKENKPTVCSMDSSSLGLDNNPYAPLTVNCEIGNAIKPLENCSIETCLSKVHKIKETLSPAIWPTFADLLNDTPQIEEFDGGFDIQSEDIKIDVDLSELENVLNQLVAITRGCSVLSLMDLYSQLNKVVSKYSRTYERNDLPKEFKEEISRFQDNQTKCVSTSRCSTPNS